MRANLLRVVVFLAIALAVPAQGFAAAVGGLCTALGHHGSAESEAQDHHDHGGDGDSHATGHGDFATPAPQDHEAHSQGHCAPCVACCAATAIVATLYTSTLQFQASAPQSSAVPVPASIQPDALDRPPLAG
jgi:hypothetical protein